MKWRAHQGDYPVENEQTCRTSNGLAATIYRGDGGWYFSISGRMPTEADAKAVSEALLKASVREGLTVQRDDT